MLMLNVDLTVQVPSLRTMLWCWCAVTFTEKSN